jgi:hypothetical protein
MEHHLGPTCAPVDGLVQIPCGERNAIASVRRSMPRAWRSTETAATFKTMRETGADMLTIHKETARGGLAINIVECCVATTCDNMSAGSTGADDDDCVERRSAVILCAVPGQEPFYRPFGLMRMKMAMAISRASGSRWSVVV